MSGGYAGIYKTLISDQQGLIHPWEYVTKSDLSPWQEPGTNGCTDIYCLNRLSDNFVCGTSGTNKIYVYDDGAFTPVNLLYTDHINRIKIMEYFAGTLAALTGNQGYIYRGFEYHPDQWSYDENYVLPDSGEAYDLISYGNFIFACGGNDAGIYRRVFESPFKPTGELPESISDVYSLGYIGNILLAGADDGIILGTRDKGERWARAVKLGTNTEVVNLDYFGTLYPWSALASAEGESGGLYFLNSPDEAILESSALYMESKDTTFGRLYYDANVNTGGVEVWARTFYDFDDQDKPIAPPWDDNALVEESGMELEDLSSVMRGDRYLQYRVKLHSGPTGESPQFEEIRIEYGTLGYDTLLPDEEVAIIPNPVKGNKCGIYYSLGAPATVTARIYDIKGREITSLTENGDELISGQYLDWDTSGVAPGVYFVHVSALDDGGVEDHVVKKVAILK
jgi:hypothetical protein